MLDAPSSGAAPLARRFAVLTLLLIAATFGAAAPHQAQAALSPCTATASSASQVQSLVASAAGGTTVCLTAGTYSKITLSGAHNSDVTLHPVEGAKVTINGIDVARNATHLVIQGFYVNGEIDLYAGASYITVDHNDISGGYSAVLSMSQDCSVPHAPSWDGCTASAPISNIVIRGNRMHDFGTAERRTPLRTTNFRHLQILENEITGVTEEGSHHDCFQNVFGGDDLLFARNYEHDNRCQGFFIKDGDASNVVLDNNLFLRNDVPCTGDFSCPNGAPHTVSVQYITNFRMTRNTVWPGKIAGGVLFLEDGGTNYQVDHNVIQTFIPYDSSSSHVAHYLDVLSEDYNLFCDGYTWVPQHMGPHSTRNCSPPFVDPAHDDYRLANDALARGVTWKPSDYVYGPAGAGIVPAGGTGGGPSAPTGAGAGSAGRGRGSARHVRVLADATIRRSHAHRRYGKSSVLRAGGRRRDRFLVRFRIRPTGGRRIARVWLRLHVRSGALRGVIVRRTAILWREKRVSWAKRPATRSKRRVGVRRVAARSRWVDVNVSKLVRHSGKYSLLVSSRSRAILSSRQAREHRPRLVVKLAR